VHHGRDPSAAHAVLRDDGHFGDHDRSYDAFDPLAKLID